MGLTVVEILRAQHINRWTIVATTRPQSLAEHTFNTIAMFRDLCHRMSWDDVIPMKAAFEHDLDEVLTGDIPSPAKAIMRSKGMEPKELEGPQKNVDKLTEIQHKAFKAIDILESVHFLDNFGTGQRANFVRQRLWEDFMDRAEALQEVRGGWLFEQLHELASEILESVSG